MRVMMCSTFFQPLAVESVMQQVFFPALPPQQLENIETIKRANTAEANFDFMLRVYAPQNFLKAQSLHIPVSFLHDINVSKPRLMLDYSIQLRCRVAS